MEILFGVMKMFSVMVAQSLNILKATESNTLKGMNFMLRYISLKLFLRGGDSFYYTCFKFP